MYGAHPQRPHPSIRGRRRPRSRASSTSLMHGSRCMLKHEPIREKSLISILRGLLDAIEHYSKQNARSGATRSASDQGPAAHRSGARGDSRRRTRHTRRVTASTEVRVSGNYPTCTIGSRGQRTPQRAPYYIYGLSLHRHIR